MATEKAPAAPAAAPAATPNKGKRTFLIIVIAGIVLVLVLLIVGVGVWVWKSHASSDADEGDEEVTEVSKKSKQPDAPPIFVKLDKFTVNLRPADDGNNDGYDAYMQTEITLQVDDMTADARLKNLMPRIRNDITLIMSDKQANALKSREGKAALAVEIRDAINRIAGPNPGRNQDKPPEGPIIEVLFESIIIQ